jgi:hypothetical protein
MAFDPTKPATGAPIVSAELRAQFNGLLEAIEGRALLPASVAPLTQTISNPPTQAQVQALQAKLNELIAVLKQAL